MKKTIIALVAATPLAMAALPALAKSGETACTTEPQSKWMSEDAAKAKAEEMGYQVRSISEENSCFDIYAMKDGKRAQLVMNPVDGTLVGNEGDSD